MAGIGFAVIRVASGWVETGEVVHQRLVRSGPLGKCRQNSSAGSAGRPRRRDAFCPAGVCRGGAGVPRFDRGEPLLGIIDASPKRPRNWLAKRVQRAVMACGVPSSASGRPTTRLAGCHSRSGSDGGETLGVGLAVQGGQGMRLQQLPFANGDADALFAEVEGEYRALVAFLAGSGMPGFIGEVGEIDAEQLECRRESFLVGRFEKDVAAWPARSTRRSVPVRVRAGRQPNRRSPVSPSRRTGWPSRATACRMSRELVRPTCSLITSVDCHWPTGRCRTKPRSVCTGPPKKTGRLAKPRPAGERRFSRGASPGSCRSAD
jgi:hypothetical protein